MPHFTDRTIEEIFGADDAENEEPKRFREYFYRNRAYEALTSDLPVRVLVGHKGVGKSALLKHAHLDDQQNRIPSVWLTPNDLVEARKSAAEQDDFILRVEEWKRGLLRAVLEVQWVAVYGEAAATVVDDLRDKNVRQLSTLLLRSVSEQRRAEHINIYIDDIDRGWSAAQNDVRNISALLTAIRDVGGQYPSIRFRIGLRSDVYFLVRTSDESTDKIERHVIWLRWRNDDILRLMSKRVATYFNMNVTQADIDNMDQRQLSDRILSQVIEPRYHGRGKWEDRPTYTILMSLTRARPRDLVKLFHTAARNAFRSNAQLISSRNLESSFEPYSQERLQDIINEFRSELPEIQRLLFEMRPTRKERRTAESYQFSNDALSTKLHQAMDHVPMHFTSGRPITPASLTQFLYKIDFVTARIEHEGFVERKYFDESRYLATEYVDFGYSWEIHPAYRWALQPQEIGDILETVDKEDD